MAGQIYIYIFSGWKIYSLCMIGLFKEPLQSSSYMITLSVIRELNNILLHLHTEVVGVYILNKT